jgi:hypothetical protein
LPIIWALYDDCDDDDDDDNNNNNNNNSMERVAISYRV